MSWPPCATPRSMSADSPDIPTSPPPNATTAGHPTPPSTPSSLHDQLDRRRSAPFHDLAMPLGRLLPRRQHRHRDRILVHVQSHMDRTVLRHTVHGGRLLPVVAPSARG